MFNQFIAAICLVVTLAASTVALAAGEPKSARFWWPELVDLGQLRRHGIESDPMGPDFDYAAEFASLDLAEVKADIDAILTDSQDWWPADYGNYGPFFIRMAWHSAGVYRIHDGRGGAAGGQQRFEPLNSWPDNGNLDKARRLLWPVKQKYGRKLSWADLMVLAGNVALENMGFETYGFAGGREDDWEAEMVYWGPESVMLGGKRRSDDGELEKPLAAVQMGLIYVNPEGPGGVPDPQASADAIREAFGRMAMNDEETAALIAGGHTFGKLHGARKPDDCVGAEPAAAGVEAQGFGWDNRCGKGNAEDTTTSGLEGAWTSAPTRWTNLYLTNLYEYDWIQTRSPAGAVQWEPREDAMIVPDAHVPGKLHKPVMTTADLALRADPAYRRITRAWLEDPEAFRLAFAKAWFKLTHRDLGPRARYVGSEVPQEELVWQDPVPAVEHPLIDERDIAQLKAEILSNDRLDVPMLVRTAWAAASTFRGTDMRGGANGGRVRLAPQRDWAANNPRELRQVLRRLERIQRRFERTSGKQVSMADLIVLAGNAAVEEAARAAGHEVVVPFLPGRTDASAEMTDKQSFAVLEPTFDGFRNYYDADRAYKKPVDALIEKADFLTLTVPEMTVLVGGMRVLDANAGSSAHGVFTDRPGTLSNDFFVNLLDMSVSWRKSAEEEGVYEGRDRADGAVKWTATPVDLLFGSHSELRAVAEVYAAADGRKKFVVDFVDAWTKVMNLDRFDVDADKRRSVRSMVAKQAGN